MALLLESMAFPECFTEALRIEHMEQLVAMDTVNDNVMLECHRAWTDAATASENGAVLGSSDWTDEVVTSRNVFFMSMLMLNA